MSISTAIFKAFLEEPLKKNFRNAWRLFSKFRIPSLLLMGAGGALVSLFYCYVDNLRQATWEARTKSQDSLLSQCRSESQSALNSYLQDKEIKDSTIQISEFLLSQKNIHVADIVQKLHPTINSEQQKSLEEVSVPPPQRPPVLKAEEIKEIDSHQREEAKTDFFDTLSNKLSSLNSHIEVLEKDKESEDNNIVENNTPKKSITAQALAACVLVAANSYHVPAAVIIGIMQAQGGRIGQDIEEKDGTHDFGPLLINSRVVSELSMTWGINEEVASRWLKDDACVNVNVGAWLLRQKMDNAGSLWAGIAAFHSSDKKEGGKYAEEVIKIMDKKGLINHDVPLMTNKNGSILSKDGRP